MNYLDTFLPSPFFEPEYQKRLPNFLSESEHDAYKIALTTQSDKWVYRHKNVEYALNSAGYRTSEWKDICWNDAIVIFGCSHVFGEGVAHDETIASHLELLMNRPVINLGVPGSSSQFNWHNSLVMHKVYGVPYAVVMIWPNISRLPYYGTNKCKRIGPWSNSLWDNYDRNASELYSLWNADHTHTTTEFKFLVYNCQKFWNHQTKFAQGSYDALSARLCGVKPYVQIDQARDLLHYGNNTHKAAATQISLELS
jgi:hypothetical protein